MQFGFQGTYNWFCERVKVVLESVCCRKSDVRVTEVEERHVSLKVA